MNQLLQDPWATLMAWAGDTNLQPLLAIGAGLLAVLFGTLLLRRARRAVWAAAFSAALVAGWWWASRTDAWAQLLDLMP
jgi:hypothetical protein